MNKKKITNIKNIKNIKKFIIGFIIMFGLYLILKYILKNYYSKNIYEKLEVQTASQPQENTFICQKALNNSNDSGIQQEEFISLQSKVTALDLKIKGIEDGISSAMNTT
jgi:hypothetical protein